MRERSPYFSSYQSEPEFDYEAVCERREREQQRIEQRRFFGAWRKYVDGPSRYW